MGVKQEMGMSLEALYDGGKHLVPPIAHSFHDASNQLSKADATAAFTRPAGIGASTTGPLLGYQALVSALVSATRISGDVMHDVADNLIKTAQDVARTDGDIKAAFVKAGGTLP